MGAGESDVRSIVVNTANSVDTTGGIKSYFDNTTGTNTFDNWYIETYPYSFTYSWPSVIYKYQIKCPVRACKKMNWLELDKITPCTNCGAKLKAVSQTADFEIPIGT